MSDKKQTLQQQLDQLQEIVAWFERDDVDIETAITRFEQGAELAQSIKEQLVDLENKITVLKMRFDGDA